jgi:hypothetical protein
VKFALLMGLTLVVAAGPASAAPPPKLPLTIETLVEVAQFVSRVACVSLVVSRVPKEPITVKDLNVRASMLKAWLEALLAERKMKLTIRPDRKWTIE